MSRLYLVRNKDGMTPNKRKYLTRNDIVRKDAKEKREKRKNKILFFLKTYNVEIIVIFIAISTFGMIFYDIVRDSGWEGLLRLLCE